MRKKRHKGTFNMDKNQIWPTQFWPGSGITRCYQSVTDLGTILQLEDTLHGVDGDDDRLRAQFGPGYVDA